MVIFSCFLRGTVSKLCDYSPLYDQVKSMCLSTDGYLVLAHNKGITKLRMADQEMKEYAVAPILEGKVAFTDQTNRCVKLVGRNGAAMVIAGIGEEGNKNGSGSHAAFGEPMGVCTEGDNILLTDAQVGTVKLVTTVTGTVEF